MKFTLGILSIPFLLYNIDLAWKSIVHKFVDLPVYQERGMMMSLFWRVSFQIRKWPEKFRESLPFRGKWGREKLLLYIWLSTLILWSESYFIKKHRWVDFRTQWQVVPLSCNELKANWNPRLISVIGEVFPFSKGGKFHFYQSRVELQLRIDVNIEKKGGQQIDRIYGSIH